ncbi:MAG: hypothetical protein JSR19_01870 [Proteobacteria bacterium]|nr:hypothetical protein [Pseudomonadota bacterium]HQR03545.1 hypothetical protein [Rhodocyclaceae bacterium]
MNSLSAIAPSGAPGYARYVPRGPNATYPGPSASTAVNQADLALLAQESVTLSADSLLMMLTDATSATSSLLDPGSALNPLNPDASAAALYPLMYDASLQSTLLLANVVDSGASGNPLAAYGYGAFGYWNDMVRHDPALAYQAVASDLLANSLLVTA